MNQADVSKLVSKLRIKVKAEPRKLRCPEGPEGRLNKLRKSVTALIKYERIELNAHRADETRQYAERLISEAIRHGDCHKPTMETADYWLLDKELVHKLFKVLVPRYDRFHTAYTSVYKAPKPQFDRNIEKAVLELRNNPFPPLANKQAGNRLLLQNILLDAAKRDYQKTKFAEMADNIGEQKDMADTIRQTKETSPVEHESSKSNNIHTQETENKH